MAKKEGTVRSDDNEEKQAPPAQPTADPIPLSYAMPIPNDTDPERSNPWIAAFGCAAIPFIGLPSLLIGIWSWGAVSAILSLVVFAAPLTIPAALFALADCMRFEIKRKGYIDERAGRWRRIVIAMAIVAVVLFVVTFLEVIDR